MNLGKSISEANRKFAEDYKKYGFATKTQLADAALTELRRKFARQRRAHRRAEALEEYAKSRPVKFWRSMDGDQFE